MKNSTLVTSEGMAAMDDSLFSDETAQEKTGRKPIDRETPSGKESADFVSVISFAPRILDRALFEPKPLRPTSSIWIE